MKIANIYIWIDHFLIPFVTFSFSLMCTVINYFFVNISQDCGKNNLNTVNEKQTIFYSAHKTTFFAYMNRFCKEETSIFLPYRNT